MSVDVIIPAYNPGIFLDEAIQSVLAQSYEDINIFIIDDNSNEDVYSIVKKYKKINYIKNERNMGPSYSRNVGIRASSSEYISFLDADDVWCRDKLKSSIGALKSDDSIGMTCGNYRRIMSGGVITRPFYRGPVDINLESLLKCNYVASGSVTVKRNIVEKAGLFDERFRVCEDYALWLSIAKIAKICYIDEVLYFYRVVPNGSSITQSPGIQPVMDLNCETIRNEIYDKRNIK
tara:strand:+ start:590 stop:1291 length:702 start_codon:yes stop_codon:yes gene_type:complete